MAHVPLDRLQPGAVVAADVADRHGRLLMRAGTLLTDRQIRALRMWGIDGVELESTGDDGEGGDAPEPGPPPWAVRQAEAEAGEAFRFNPPGVHPLVDAVRRARVKAEAVRIGRSAAPVAQGVGHER